MGKKKGIVEKIASSANKVMDKASSEKKNQAEDAVKKTLDQIPKEANISGERHYVFAEDKDKGRELCLENVDDGDKLISQIENLAFKHQLYRVSENYSAMYPFECEKDDAGNERNSYVIKRTSTDAQMAGLILKRIVFSKDELQYDKLNNIFSSMVDLENTLAMVIHRTKKECIISFVIKSNSESDPKTDVNNNIKTLINGIKGNFPGIELVEMYGNGIPRVYSEFGEVSDADDRPLCDLRGCAKAFRDGKAIIISDETGNETKLDYSLSEFWDEIFNYEQCKAVSVLTGVPSIKSKDSKYINQGIEKLLDGVVPSSDNGEDNYTLILLAEPLSPNAVSGIKNGYERLSSILSPYKGFQFSCSYNDSFSKNVSENKNLANQISEATAYSLGIGAQAGASANASVNATITDGTADTSNFKENQGNFGKRVRQGFRNAIFGSDSGKGAAGKKLTGSSSSTNHSDASGANAGANANIGISANVSINQSITAGRTYTNGITYGGTETSGETKSLTREYTSDAIKLVLERLEKNIKRLTDSESSGMWRFAGYVISGDRAMSQRVANVYQGMIQGEDSSLEKSTVNTWNFGEENFNPIILSLLNMQHPQFAIKRDSKNKEYLPEQIYCASEICSPELALALNLPQKAVSGIPVVECTPYGRNVCTIDGKVLQGNEIHLGKVFHMLVPDKYNEVRLEKDKLTSHSFVTGSTGVGKSTTIYKMIQELVQPERFGETVEAKGTPKFLIIEPTKGEYKDIFGGWKDVNVFGTNDRWSELLTINPFAFPSNTIHVLEHIDRLVEIFNACWPMYAAMPAILKDAIIQSYRVVGWNLDDSSSKTGRFPNFRILLEVLPGVIAKSNYSKDTHSDYVGALVTRVNSLTTGLNGKILNSAYDISDEILFNQNTIIDISKVGSDESKALLMGVLMLKLQEWRMNERLLNPGEMDSSLKHCTVLEEAHLLLRKTSAEQSQEGSNLQGKSVEMITNAIAEMRTYGEAFIIADQAPMLLDEAVIRNTNTKIVMRLPDEGDRKVVGGSLALNDEQIKYLSKLPNHVAAVYQSDWIEPVLCEIESFGFKKFKKPHVYSREKMKERYSLSDLILELANGEDRELKKEEIKILLCKVERKSPVLSTLLENNVDMSSRNLLTYILGGEMIGKSIFTIMQDQDDVARENLRILAERIKSEFELEDIEISYRVMGICFDSTIEKVGAISTKELSCLRDVSMRMYRLGRR